MALVPGGLGMVALSGACPHRAAIFSQLSSACSFFILLSWLPTFFRETFPSSQVRPLGPCRAQRRVGDWPLPPGSVAA